jgi:hypothetical protein
MYYRELLHLHLTMNFLSFNFTTPILSPLNHHKQSHFISFNFILVILTISSLHLM